jgi:hypothetical protein
MLPNFSADGDFLSLHIQSLLIRQPTESKGQQHSQQAPVNDRAECLLGEQALLTPSRRFNNNDMKINTSPPSSRFSSQLSPTDNIFGNGMSTAVGMTTNGGPSTIQQGRVGSNGYDYFSRVASGPSNSAQHRQNSSSISTKFGRRPSLRSNNSSSLHNRSASRDQDAMSESSSALTSSKESSMLLESSLDRRPSDGTTATGITSPMTEIEQPEWPQLLEKDTCAPTADSSLDIDELEGDVSESQPMTPYSASLMEEFGDQTTWERFKRGGVIEPPEAEVSSSMSASWINGTISYSNKITMMSPRRVCNREQSKDTVKANASDTADSTTSGVTLIPCSNDGRTFRFTSR